MWAVRAADSISDSVALGVPKAMLLAMVVEKR